MAYRLLAPRDHTEQQDKMWDAMGYDHHVALIKRRSILPVFPRYLRPGARILEAGCGLGGWVYFLNQEGYWTVGVDNNIKILGESDRTHLKLCENDILQICFPSDTFDCYLSLGVVEHFPDGPGPALAEAYRVIKPGGYIFVSTPTTNLVRTLFNHRVRDCRDLIYRALGRRLYFAEYRFTKSELVNHVRGAGFEILETLPNDARLDQNAYSIGFFTDWPPLRSSEKYRLNGLGRLVFAGLKALSPYLVVSGILVVGRKPTGTRVPETAR